MLDRLLGPDRAACRRSCARRLGRAHARRSSGRCRSRVLRVSSRSICVNGHNVSRPWPSAPTSSSSGVSTSLKRELELARALAPAHRQLFALDPRRIRIDQHGRELRSRALLAWRSPEHEHALGEIDSRGHRLDPVDHETLAVPPHCGRAAKDVVPAVRLGHRQCQKRLTGGDSLEPALAHVLRSNRGDRVTDRGAQHRHPQDQVRCGERLHHHRVGEQSALRSAVLDRHQQAGPAALADLPPQLRDAARRARTGAGAPRDGARRSARRAPAPASGSPPRAGAARTAPTGWRVCSLACWLLLR